jgi:pimeloyl-ACP methyl ester carboxylesterase
LKKLQQAKYHAPEDHHEFDGYPLVIHARPGRTAPNLVLLIHGLTGHRYSYWEKLPQFLMEDLPHADVGLYYYRTAWRRFGIFTSIDLEDEARVLADELRRLKLYSAITLVGHSMGGILAKAAIASLISRNFMQPLKKISGLVLLASPQLGSLRVPGWVRWISRDGRALYPHGRLLRDIDVAFSTRLNLDQSANPGDKYSIPAWAVLGAEDFWVDALSAGIGIPEAQKHTVRAKHGGVKDPTERNNDAYVVIRDALDTAFKPRAFSNDEEIAVENASPDDVPTIRQIALSYFGEDVTPEQVMRDLVDADEVFKIVKRIFVSADERRERVSGYVCFIPIGRKTYESIVAGNLKGAELTIDHVQHKDEPAYAVYIGAIAAKDYYSRAIVVEALRLRIKFAAALGVDLFLTRPVTEDGLRLCNRHGFRPLGKPGLQELYQFRPNDKQARWL